MARHVCWREKQKTFLHLFGVPTDIAVADGLLGRKNWHFVSIHNSQGYRVLFCNISSYLRTVCTQPASLPFLHHLEECDDVGTAQLEEDKLPERLGQKARFAI